MPPVVYVHGFIGHLRFPELREGIAGPVLAPDLIGYGASTEHRSPALTVSRQASHLQGTLSRDIGDQPVVLVGHSGGAAICVRLAHTHPERVAAIISAEGNLSPADASLSSRIAPMTPEQVALWLENARAHPEAFFASDRVVPTRHQMDRMREWLLHQPASVIHAMARAVLVETVHPAYERIVRDVMTNIPTYLIRGANSPRGLGTSRQIETLSRGVFDIEGAGHMMVLEEPSRFAACVAGICNRLPTINHLMDP
ncbi:alpha/beta hydrolase [Bacillus sp. NP157]|nr:alpha/beta hydrolase [Bacillus sp. NP157]